MIQASMLTTTELIKIQGAGQKLVETLVMEAQASGTLRRLFSQDATPKPDLLAEFYLPDELWEPLDDVAFLPEQRVDAIAVFLNPIPLPVRWRIRFLPPVETDADTDALGLLELTDQIRDTIQRNLDEMVENRDTVF